MPLVSFFTPWKPKKTSGSVIFSGGIERDQWYEMVKAKETNFQIVNVMLIGTLGKERAFIGISWEKGSLGSDSLI